MKYYDPTREISVNCCLFGGCALYLSWRRIIFENGIIKIICFVLTILFCAMKRVVEMWECSWNLRLFLSVEKHNDGFVVIKYVLVSG